MVLRLRAVSVLLGATTVFVLSACSPVEFGAIKGVNLQKTSSDVGAAGTGTDPAAADDTISIEIPNYRECTLHETDVISVYSPDPSSRARSDVYFAFMNVDSELDLNDEELYDLAAEVQGAGQASSLSDFFGKSAVVVAQKSSFASGAARFAQLEQRKMSIPVGQAAYQSLIAQAQASKSSAHPLRTVFVAFDDVDHNGAFTPGKDRILSSSEGIPVRTAKAGVASLASKSTFVDNSAGVELKYQARTQLLMMDAGECEGIDDPDYRSMCKSSCDAIEDPLVIDLFGNGFHATSVAEGVEFDIAGRGQVRATAWLTPNSGQYFLAMDRNGNGRIDDGSELFGMTPLANGTLPSNGFESLKALDSNGDGLIDANDKQFSRLVLWDGDVSGAVSKLMPLSQAVSSISLDYQVKDQSDEHGNRIYAKSVVKLANGQTREIADIWLAAAR